MDDKVAFLPVDRLLEPKSLLRLVDRNSLDYMQMLDSIREWKVLKPILVRPSSQDGYYEIIDGLYRYSCAKDAGLATVPAHIKHGVTDDDVLILQIQTNAISPETKPMEYAEQMKRLLVRKPDLTVRELARLIRKSTSWINDRLGLLNLRKELKQVVERGEISLANAYMLAKIPKSMQLDYVDQAKTMPGRAFKALAAACVKRFMEAVQQGKMDAFYAEQFSPQAHLRSLTDIENEISKQGVGALVAVGEGCQTVLDGFYAGLRWACHLDRASVQEQEATIRGRERQVLDVSALDESPS